MLLVTPGVDDGWSCAMKVSLEADLNVNFEGVASKMKI